MSIDRNIYLGPYLACTFKLVDRTKDYAGCPKCKKSIHTKHCPDCGSPKGMYQDTKTVPSVDEWKVSEDVNECFSMATSSAKRLKNEHIWVINRSVGFEDRKLHLEDVGELCLDVNSLNIEKELAWFCMNYNSELLEIGASYESTEIKFGLVVWCS